MSEFGTSSSTPLSPEQIEQKKQQGRTNYYLRLPLSYVPFFQAMARDYYQRGEIKSPTIGLLAKTCLITAGNAWNRMQVQQMNKGYEKKSRQVELERQRHQQQQQDHQERGEFVQSSGDIASQSVPAERPLPFLAEETKRQLQQQTGNLVTRSMTEPGNPTFSPRLDTSSTTWKLQHAQPADEFY